MHQIVVIGHLGKDPEHRVTANGNKVTTLLMADNIRKDVTVWFRVTLWRHEGDRYENMLNFMKKGSVVVVTGKMTRHPRDGIYQNKDGMNDVSMEITASDISFGPSSRQGEEGGGMGSQSFGAPQGKSADQSNDPMGFGAATGDAGFSGMASGQGMGDVADDNIPF